MTAAFLITILPTLLFFILLPKFGINIKNNFLKISFAWFAGIYTFTFATFFFSLFYSTFTTAVLMKASFTVLLITLASLFFFAKDIHHIISRVKHNAKTQTLFSIPTLFLVSFCLLFSFLFFAPHVSMQDGKIFRSEIYWDFHWHAAVIQNFVYGDNFPPENEAFPKTPMTYHFFGDLAIAIYEAVGLNLAQAITSFSILSFFFLLMSIIGISKEFFHSKWIGFLAVLLVITSSSGHFLYYFNAAANHPLYQTIHDIFTNAQHPWYTSFIPGNPFGYNGTMFNLFFFLEERHMIISVVYLMFCIYLIYNRSKYSLKMLFILGSIMGSFFFWHVFITIMVLIGIFFTAIFDRNRKRTIVILLGCFFITALQYDALKSIIAASPSFIHNSGNYPQINFRFVAETNHYGYITIIYDFIMFYVFALGLKILLVPIALITIWRKNRSQGALLTAFIIPIFVVINTLQFSPSGVGENHKFLLNMLFVADIATAYLVYTLFFKRQNWWPVGVVCMFFLTISGVIEHMPYINTSPARVHEDYSPSSLTITIRNNTFPKATIISSNTKAVQLAGRKIFVGESAGASLSLNKIPRQMLISTIYRTNTVAEFCNIAATNNIDYVEFYETYNYPLKKSIRQLPHFTATDINNYPLLYVDAHSGCHRKVPS